MSRLLAITIGAVLAACSGAAEPGSGPSGPPSPSPPKDSTMFPTTLAWRRHALVTGGVSLDLVDGPPIAEGDAAGFHYVSQAHPPVQLDLWLGPDISLAWWRGRFGSRNAVIGPETSFAVCGRAARRQEVSVSDQRATGLVPGSGGLGHVEDATPAEVHVALGATTAAGTPFVVSWRVSSGQRDALRGDETHFLASLRCP